MSAGLVEMEAMQSEEVAEVNWVEMKGWGGCGRISTVGRNDLKMTT